MDFEREVELMDEELSRERELERRERHTPAELGRVRTMLHVEDCPRHEHFGPCHGPLRGELPETPEERYERHVDAVVAVLRRRVEQLAPWVADGWIREAAEECVAAADAGF